MATARSRERHSESYCQVGWVGRTHCWVRPPEEPDLRLSPHPARAGPSGLITRGRTIRSGKEIGQSAGPLTATVVAASSLSVGWGVVVIFVLRIHLTTSARFRARAPSPVSVAPMSRAARYLRLLSSFAWSQGISGSGVADGSEEVEERRPARRRGVGIELDPLLRNGQMTVHTSNRGGPTRPSTV